MSRSKGRNITHPARVANVIQRRDIAEWAHGIIESIALEIPERLNHNERGADAKNSSHGQLTAALRRCVLFNGRAGHSIVPGKPGHDRLNDVRHEEKEGEENNEQCTQPGQSDHANRNHDQTDRHSNNEWKGTSAAEVRRDGAAERYPETVGKSMH